MASPSPLRHERTARAGCTRRERSWWFQVHFWIGWIFALPLLVVCVTGIGLAFEKEFYAWEQPEHYALEPGGAAALSLPEVLEIYETARPRLHLNYLEVPESPARAYLGFATEVDETGKRLGGLRAYLNPYTGEITREKENPTLIRLLEVWHRNLTLGPTGRTVIGVSSLLLAVTSVAGLILWWPMRGGTFDRAVRRRRALDWHNALGLLALLPLCILAVTGITFTWGKHVFPTLDRLQGGPSRFEVPEIPAAKGDVNGGVSLAETARQIERDFPDHRIIGVQGSLTPSRPYVFSLHTSGDLHPGGSLRLFIDSQTGDEFARHEVSEDGPVGWYRRYFYIFHTGHPFSWPVRVLWALASLAGAVLVVTGSWISIKRWRRPRRSSAA